MVDELEKVIRAAINSFAPLKSVSEKTYCEVIAEALDVIKEGAEMRLQEIERDEE